MKTQSYKKIITHAGAFHADEILAIATVFHFYNEIPVERVRRVEQMDLDDPEILVLDIGREYKPLSGNFDHHQSPDLQATNLLILKHFSKNSTFNSLLIKSLYQYVSLVDVGKIIEGKGKSEFLVPSFSSLVKNLNHVEKGFELALQMAKITLAAHAAGAYKILESKSLWKALEFEKGIAVQHDQNVIVGWQELAEQQKIQFLITPNIRGGYQIISRDSGKFPIEKISETQQTFLHNAQFLAVYTSFETALNHARKMIRDL